MKLIPLTQGKFAMVDDADYEAVSQFKWHVDKKGRRFYAARTLYKPGGKRTNQYIHQLLMPGVSRVDHRDGNGLNYQRENLRPATNRQNAQGFCHKKLGSTSKYRGVCWDKKVSKWMAYITVNSRLKFLGYFIDETKAAHAYDSAAIFYFGEWASTNFPIGDITIT